MSRLWLLVLLLAVIPAKAAPIPEVSTPAAKHALLTVRSWVIGCHWKQEWGAVVEDDGTFKLVSDSANDHVRLTTDTHTVLTIHTHRDGYPQPSPQDIENAIRTRVPTAVLSPQGVEIAMPDGRVVIQNGAF